MKYISTNKKNKSDSSEFSLFPLDLYQFATKAYVSLYQSAYVYNFSYIFEPFPIVLNCVESPKCF